MQVCHVLYVLVAWALLEQVAGGQARDGLDKDPIGSRDGDGLAQLQGTLFSLELKCEALVQADEGDLCLQSTDHT